MRNPSAEAARKLISETIARAALLEIEVRELAGDAWLLRHARGSDIGIMLGVPALSAAVAGFEAAHRDVRALVQHREALLAARGAQSPTDGLATLKVRATLAGFELRQDADGFTLERRGRSVKLADADAVAVFLHRAGAI